MGAGVGGLWGPPKRSPLGLPLGEAKTKMAEVGMNLLPSGYEYEFISTVLDDHHCLICHLPLREPVQTRCGHRFCKKCLDEAIRRYENRNRVLTLGLCICYIPLLKFQFKRDQAHSNRRSSEKNNLLCPD